MNIKGSVTAVLRDKDTGKITRTYTADNHFQDVFLGDGLTNLNPSVLGTYLWVSETNPGRQRYDWPSTIPNCIARDTIISRDLFLDHTNESHMIQMVQRFNAPASDITINMAGVSNSISAPSNVTGVNTVVWFDTPCVQTTTETLDLFYRIFVMFDPNWKTAAADSKTMTRYESARLATYLANIVAPDYLVEALSSTHEFTTSAKFNPRRLDESNYTDSLSTLTGTSGTNVNYVDVDEFRRGLKVNMAISQMVGHMVATMSTENSLLMSKVLPVGASPVQSVFGHRSTSDVPFYDASTAQLSLGQLSINGDAWTDPDYPKMYFIDMQTDGLTGVSTYKLRVRNVFGFEGNTFNNHIMALPYTTFQNAHYSDGVAIGRDNHRDSVETTEGARSMMSPVAYNGTEVLFLWNDEIVFFDILAGTGQGFTNTTLVGADLTPRFLATDIGQAAVDSSLNTYIACRNTGIYKFNAARDTLTIINSAATGLTGTTGCMALCIGNAGRLWGYFNHTTQPSLYYSDDDGVTWVSTGMTDAYLDANPSRLLFIKADPSNVAGQVMFFYYWDASLDRCDMKWWDQLTTTVSAGPTNVFTHQTLSTTIALPYVTGQHHQLQNLVSCSPNNGTWGTVNDRFNPATPGRPTFFTFGTATKTQLLAAEELATSGIATAWATDSLGNDALIYVTSNGQTNNTLAGGSNVVLLSSDLSYETANTKIDNFNGDADDLTLYMGDGVWLCNRVLSSTAQSINNQNYLYLLCGVPNTLQAAGIDALMAEVFPSYGWNGSAWVRDNAGAKATHAAAEALIDGVTIAFDDGTGVNQFLASDHYVFGMFDGVWQDGSTTFDFTWEVYSKPSVNDTDVESPTLPAVTKVSNNILTFQTDSVLDYTDLASTDTNNIVGEIQATGTGLPGDYNAGGRSAAPAVRGDVQSALPNNVPVPLSENLITNAQGWVEFRIDMADTLHLEAYIGLSDSTVLTTALNAATIQYALHFDSITPGNGVGTCTVRVVESGIQRAVVTDIPYDDNLIPAKYRIILLNNGVMVYEYWLASTDRWTELYRTPPATVVMQNYHLDFNYVPESNFGFKDVAYKYLDTANPDYYLYLGNGVDSGLFRNEFRIIDSKYTTVTINGVEAVNIGNNDTATVLSANSYSLFPNEGVIRYSASDVGLTVSADYITVTDS